MNHISNLFSTRKGGKGTQTPFSKSGRAKAKKCCSFECGSGNDRTGCTNRRRWERKACTFLAGIYGTVSLRKSFLAVSCPDLSGSLSKASVFLSSAFSVPDLYLLHIPCHRISLDATIAYFTERSNTIKIFLKSIKIFLLLLRNCLTSPQNTL